MRVEIASDAFTPEDFDEISELIRHFVKGRHTWTVRIHQVDDITGYFHQHAPTRAATWNDLAEKSTVTQAWTGTTTPAPATVTVTQESLVDHVHDLGHAARIVVENLTSDGRFWRAVALTFGASLLLAAKEKGWVKFVHGGGCGEVPKVARAERAEFRRLSRVFFVYDSDRITPEAASKHEPAAERLRAEGIAGHILRLREIENYTPNRVLAAIPAPRRADAHHRELTARIKFLDTLTPEQRAHFDMKKGFLDHRTQQAVIPDAQKNLYGSLPAATVDGLASGFGDNLIGLLLQEAEAGKLTEADFDKLGPGVRNELRDLLARFEEII